VIRDFVDLFLALSATASSQEKVLYLERYLSTVSEEEAGWVIYLLRGGKLSRVVSPRELREWLIECTQIPPWLFEESYGVVGDLAETVSLLFSRGERRREISLTSWIALLQQSRGHSAEQRRERIVAMWTELTQEENLVFTKLITGGLRLGVSKGLVLRAVAKVLKVHEEKLAHLFMGRERGEEYDLSLLRRALEEMHEGRSERVGPYPFFLAHPLLADPEELGSPGEWLAEWKWDGIRAQIVKRGERYAIWSRGEEIVTESFPELAVVSQGLPQETVLDGELIAWQEGKPASFADLQRRLNRKSVTEKIMQQTPVAFIAYDILENAGVDVRALPLWERRALLESIVQAVESPQIQLSPAISFSTWSELRRQREEARSYQAEGLMLKNLASGYGIGRKRGFWWKWKCDPFSFDGVLVYAQKGHGRRADLFTDYTFAVWDGDILVPCAKAYSGLSDAEIREIDRFIKRHTQERYGPVRTVQPELVCEIAFEGIQRSSRHKSGFALRFPRIVRWRRDKSAKDADTISRLKEFLPSADPAKAIG
jgi:DNA ligase-1